jgi:hypothetical protein
MILLQMTPTMGDLSLLKSKPHCFISFVVNLFNRLLTHSTSTLSKNLGK